MFSFLNCLFFLAQLGYIDSAASDNCSIRCKISFIMSKIGDEMYGAPVSVDTANKANYRAWTNDGYGVIYYIPYTFRRMFPFEATWKANYAHAMFNLYWHYSLVIVAAYVALVYWGQKRMANRKPYSLKGPLFVWNAVLAVFSFVAFVRMAEEMFFVLANHTFQVAPFILYCIGNAQIIFKFSHIALGLTLNSILLEARRLLILLNFIFNFLYLIF